MAEMTSRERVLRAIAHKEADRVPILDSAWKGTVRRWHAEGLPENVSWKEYFGADKYVRINVDNSPRFEKRVLEENDRYKITTTEWGVTRKVFRELDSTPEALDFYCTTPERWEEAKARMLTYYEDRIPWDLIKNNYDRWKAEGYFTQLVLWFGFDVTHSHMVGTENLLIAMFDEPEWVKDMFDTYLKVAIDLQQRLLDKGYEFDCVFWYDDMGYKGSPFFSPNTYRELLKPYHKRAVDWAHERNMVTELHSCGFIEPLIPDLVDIGVDMLNPLEVKAGMNPEYLKKTYGDKLAFHGGINAQIWDKPQLVRAEMERIIPLMKENGGYVFASDHSIPNSVSFSDMTEIIRLAKELGKY